MARRVLVMVLAAVVISPLALFGCKGKVEKAPEAPTAIEAPQYLPDSETPVIVEPARDLVAVETIPPTAAPQMAETRTPARPPKATKENKDIQTALKNAGFYAGAIDGKVGPKTKRAIEEFQRAKGLKVDGKVGPKTWTELEKYLIQQ